MSRSGRGSLLMSGGRGTTLGLLSSPSLRGRGHIINNLTGLPKSESSVESSSKASSQSLSKDSRKASVNDELADFNPMQEAFNDPAFNSYPVGFGPGSHLPLSQQVARGRERDIIKLHVSNIPSSMTKSAIKNIFNLYGDTLEVYIAPPQGSTTWGFVSYENLQQAQRAIENLDRMVPHNLNVKFAKEKEPKRNEDIKKNPEDIIASFSAVKKSTPDRKSFPLSGIKPRLHPNRSQNDRNALKSDGYHSNQFSTYNPPAQVEVNNSIMEKNTTTAHNGVSVKGGRAYIPSQAPPQPSEADNYSFHSEGKFKKLPTHTVEANPPGITCPFKQGNCTNCQSFTATVCQVCKAWYCSRTCMKNDWDEHKLVCRPKTVTFRPDGTIDYQIPPDETNDRESPVSGKTKGNNGTSNARKAEQPSERCVGSNKADDEPKDVNPSPKRAQFKIDYTQHPPEPRDDGYVLTEKGLISNRNAKYEAKIHIREPERKRGSYPKSSQTEAPSKPAPEPPIPRGAFSECLILFTTPEYDWCSVTPVSLAAQQDEMMADLAEYFCQARPNATNVSTGAICGTQFDDGLWYRVEVTVFTKKTGFAQILFIDFGNEGEVPMEDLKVLPNKLLETPPMAFRIFFVGGKKPVEINDIVKISPIKPTPCGSWLVRTEEDPEPPEEADTKELRGEVKEEDAPLPSCPLSKLKFQPVTVMHVEQPGIFWGLTGEGMHTLLELNKSLNESARSRVKVSPELNQLYNYYYSDLWCRALLTSLDPHTVFFIDYGNSEEVDPKELLPLPSKLKSTPPLAIRIKLAEGTASKYLSTKEMEILSLRAHGKPSNYILALVEGESYVQSALDHEMAKAAELTTPMKPNHVLSLLTPKSDAFIAVTKTIGEDHFCGSLQIVECPQPYQSVNEISKTLITTKSNPSFKPALNDDVIAKINKDSRLYRGYVMCTEETTRVALIDLGCVETPCKLAALPPEFKDIPPSGVRVSLHQPTSCSLSDLLGSEFTLKNITITGEEVTADFGSYGQATITPWVPLLEEAHIPVFKLDNKSQALVTAFHTPQVVYVRPLTPDCIEVFSCVIQDVCAFCVLAKPLQKPPLLGELVSARSKIDDNFYRALISKKENNRFKVIFLDFGNVETVDLEDLRSLPDNFKKIPATVVKVGLKNVPGPLFDKYCTQTMSKAVAKETKFIVTHDGDLRDVVLTEESSGDVVNDILAQAMEPSWAKNSSDLLTAPPYMNTDIRYDEWNEGDKLEGTVVGSPSYCQILFVQRSTLFEYIHTVLTPQMTKYCQEYETTYSPIANEVVMAKFEGDWYRALCISQERMSNAPTAEVFFIDYGNIGEMHIEDMRKMVPEFAHMHAAVKNCKIYGLPRSESISDKNKEKLTEALVALTNVEITVVKQFEGGSAVVWIPALEDTLTALGISYTRPVGFS